MNANWLTPPPHQRNDCHTISCGGAKRHDLQTAARSGRQTPHPWRRTPKLFQRHTPLSASGRTDTRSTVVAPLLVMTHTAQQPRRSAISQCHHAAGELWLPPVAAMNAASCRPAHLRQGERIPRRPNLALDTNCWLRPGTLTLTNTRRRRGR